MGGGILIIFFSAKEISTKLKTFAHTEFDKEQFTNIEKIERLINERKDVYGRGWVFKKNDNIYDLPEYVIKNKKILKDFF